MLIAQISDTHIVTGEDAVDLQDETAIHLQRAVDHLLGLPARPDVVLITGDCVNGGSMPEYQRFRNLIAPLTMPVCEEVDFGAMIVAERLTLPHATVLVIAAGSFIRPAAVAEPLNEVRAEHDLPPDPDLAMLSRYLVLSPFPPSYRDPAFPLPATAHSIRPTLVAPTMGADQPLNAARCAALGVGLALDAVTATPESVRAAVTTVLSDPRYRHAAERMRDEIAALPGPEYAVGLLERLVL